MQEQKTQIRDKLLQQLSNSKSNKAVENKVLSELLFLPQFSLATSLLLYSAIEYEINVNFAIDYALGRDKQVFIPIIDEISVGRIGSRRDLKRKNTKILEAQISEDLENLSIDLAVLPGVAFGRDGSRIGRGFGWYDKLFSKLNCKYKVGVCLDSQLLDSLPSESHDQKMDCVITPSEVVVLTEPSET